MAQSDAQDRREIYASEGYLVVKNLFSPAECDSMREHFMELVENGGGGFAETLPNKASEDPLKRYPRLLHPHRNDRAAMDFMLDPRIGDVLKHLLGIIPLAVQSMVYFKPAGSLGQALHQDNRYLRAKPGTCHAAWLALEDCDYETGCLSVVPRSHAFPVLCPVPSDPSLSFTKDVLTLPPGLAEISAPLEKGDVMFFHGQLIHGSTPNRSPSRFRPAIIAHYIEGDAREVAEFYHPIWTFAKQVVELEKTAYGGGPCGILLEDGSVDPSGTIERALSAH
jgi:ectoine hydroxylase-related dioxygenase (phytanoyl-CoA dioxygenase family)